MEREPDLLEVPAPERQERPETPHKRPVRTALVLGVGLLALFLFGYLPRRQRDRALQAAAERERQSLPVVNIVRVKRAPPTSSLLLPGNIQAFTDAPIYARADGYLRRRYVDIGDRVGMGQLLAEIETPDL